MTDSSTTSSAWGEAWLDAQRKYFESWADLAGQGMNPFEQGSARPSGDNNPFAAAFEQWWKMIEPNLPEQGRAAGQRLREMNQGYLRLGEQIWKLAENMESAMKGGGDWRELMQQQVAKWQKEIGDRYSAADAWSNPWGEPLKQWRQLYSSFGISPEDIEAFIKPGASMDGDAIQRMMKQALATPGLGYTREMQEEWQKLGALWLEHANVLKRYEKLLADVGGRTAEKIGAKLMEMTRDGKSVTGLREAYDLWVECAEAAYAELANSADFVETQAALSNTLMEVKKHQQEMMESAQRAFDLPTRGELDTAHARIHALRREVRDLKRRLEESDGDSMQGQIDELRAELAALREAPATPAPAPAPTKKKAATRRAAPKATTKTAAKKED